MSRRIMLVVAGLLVVAALHPASAFAQNWIEYAITGATTLENRDENAVICGASSGGFKAGSRGVWYFDIKAEGKGRGQHAAEFTVVAPRSETSLRDDDFSTDDRFRGEGTITIEAAGRDQLGMELVNVVFIGPALHSEAGYTINVEGTLSCAVM